ncbi:hypothetical protein BDN72DRAFT_550211 [Pluteus cervinus]|uniref:Uncharacterized protein n=1 Tax=Pluteus cervinus TaxID=181527 RepID=A0ACD3A3A4_9AGAR|nr:hypothetical protein BDN72DRAFT_550211 [Pluteus cervinus]
MTRFISILDTPPRLRLARDLDFSSRGCKRSSQHYRTPAGSLPYPRFGAWYAIVVGSAPFVGVTDNREILLASTRKCSETRVIICTSQAHAQQMFNLCRRWGLVDAIPNDSYSRQPRV